MEQLINLLWYNSFVNRQRLSLLYEKTGTITLTLLGLMASWIGKKTLGNVDLHRQSSINSRMKKFQTLMNIIKQTPYFPGFAF